MLWADLISASKKHPGEVKIQWKVHNQPIFSRFVEIHTLQCSGAQCILCSMFFCLFLFYVCTMDSVPKRCYCQMTAIQNKRKGISAGIVVFYERNKTNVCSGVSERRYNAALIYGSFKSHIMPALTIAIYCSCIIHFFYLSNFMIIWKSQKVKLQSPGLIFISMIK